MPSLDRFSRAHPGWLFALRICAFGLFIPLLTWRCIITGHIQVGHDVGSIERAVHPLQFWIIIAMFAGGALFVTLISTIIFLKKKRLIRRNWKLFGMDARF